MKDDYTLRRDASSPQRLCARPQTLARAGGACTTSACCVLECPLFLLLRARALSLSLLLLARRRASRCYDAASSPWRTTTWCGASPPQRLCTGGEALRPQLRTPQPLRHLVPLSFRSQAPLVRGVGVRLGVIGRGASLLRSTLARCATKKLKPLPATTTPPPQGTKGLSAARARRRRRRRPRRRRRVARRGGGQPPRRVDVECVVRAVRRGDPILSRRRRGAAVAGELEPRREPAGDRARLPRRTRRRRRGGRRRARGAS